MTTDYTSPIPHYTGANATPRMPEDPNRTPVFHGTLSTTVMAEGGETVRVDFKDIGAAVEYIDAMPEVIGGVRRMTIDSALDSLPGLIESGDLYHALEAYRFLERRGYDLEGTGVAEQIAFENYHAAEVALERGDVKLATTHLRFARTIKPSIKREEGLASCSRFLAEEADEPAVAKKLRSFAKYILK